MIEDKILRSVQLLDNKYCCYWNRYRFFHISNNRRTSLFNDPNWTFIQYARVRTHQSIPDPVQGAWFQKITMQEENPNGRFYNEDIFSEPKTGLECKQCKIDLAYCGCGNRDRYIAELREAKRQAGYKMLFPHKSDSPVDGPTVKIIDGKRYQVWRSKLPTGEPIIELVE